MRRIVRRFPRAALAVGLVGFVNAAIWSVVTPIGQAPDEWAHIAYVQSLAEHGKTPSRDAASPLGRVAAEEATLLDESFSFTVVTDPQVKPPWSKRDEREWRRYEALKRPARDNGGGYTTIAAHPPLYYLLEVVPYKIGSSGSLVTRIQLMRLFTALFAGLTAVFAWFLVRELFGGRRWLATTAGLCVALQPMIGFMGGAVNNDVPVAMFATLELYLLIRALRRGLSPALGLGIGLVLGLGSLTKGNMLIFVPVVAFALVLCAWRRRKQVRPLLAGLAGVAAGLLAVLAIWGLFELTIVAGSGGAAPIVAANDLNLRLFGSYAWQFYLPKLPFMQTLHFGIPGEDPAFTLWIKRLWGDFGWLTIELPSWVYDVIRSATLAILALACVALYRERGVVRDRIPEILVCLAAVAAIIVLVHRLFFPGSLGQMAEQGRYLFPVIGVLGAAIAGACLAAGRRYGTVLAVAAVAGVLALNAASIGEVARQFFT